MKNQYFADIGDYGKYGLLRFLANKGISIAVNWYLTLNDDPPTNDGHFRDYLGENKKDQFNIYDPLLFECLREMHEQKQHDVKVFEKMEMIPNAKYYPTFIDSVDWLKQSAKERLSRRLQWHADALKICNGTELVFLDPDNGLKDEDINGRVHSQKYVFSKEALEYFNRGQDVVYYCHKGRRKQSAWNYYIETLKRINNDIHLKVLTYHRGTQRSYVFAIHPYNVSLYDRIIADFEKTEWVLDGLFEIEQK